jgi:hypothetical protein
VDAPDNYLCPITKQLMREPVILVDTGQTYEAAALHRWLDTRDTCPLNGEKLHSKQTAPNFIVKSLIAEWAATHNVMLPPASTYTFHSSHSGGSAAAAAAGGHGSSYSSSHPVPGTTINIDDGDSPATKGRERAVALPWRCTRTRWAVLAIAILLAVAVAVGLAVALPRLTRGSKGEACVSMDVLVGSVKGGWARRGRVCSQ